MKKNCNPVNYVSEPVNNVVNCSCSTSTSSIGFVCQVVGFNKYVHKHIVQVLLINLFLLLMLVKLFLQIL